MICLGTREYFVYFTEDMQFLEIHYHILSNMRFAEGNFGFRMINESVFAQRETHSY